MSGLQFFESLLPGSAGHRQGRLLRDVSAYRTCRRNEICRGTIDLQILACRDLKPPY